MIQKIAEVLSKCIFIMYVLLVIGIFIATLLIDKYIANPFPNTVRYANGGYYFIAFLLFLLLIWCLVYFENNKDICVKVKDAYFYMFVFGWTILVFGLQVFISRWFPIEIGADFTICKNAAIQLANGGSFAKLPYFEMNPNNVNITIIFSWIYFLFGNWRAVILAGSFLTNLSMLFTVLTIYNYTGKKMLSFIVGGGYGTILAALTWRAFVPYTDNFGMIFVAGILWVYSSRFDSEVKMLLVWMIGLCGSLVKITVWIPVAAITISETVCWMRCSEKKILWKRAVIYGCCLCIIAGGMKSVQAKVRQCYGYQASDAEMGWQHYFMLGQNDKYYGAYNSEDVQYSQGIADYRERMHSCIEKGLQRIKDRGVAGNILFAVQKLNVAYNDGYFHNVQGEYKDSDSFWARLYLKDGRLYAWGADIMQVLWDFILIMMVISIWMRIWIWEIKSDRVLKQEKKQNQTEQMFQILILGISCYILLFENRSKYLYMFLPVYTAYAGIVLHRVLDVHMWVKAVCMDMGEQMEKQGSKLHDGGNTET